MITNNRIALSSDHSAIQLRQAIAAHIAALGWVVVDIGPTTPESTHYPMHGEWSSGVVRESQYFDYSGRGYQYTCVEFDG